MNKKIYTYDEMKERIADYCFGNLEGEELQTFENSISHYEDIAKEISEIKTAFPPERKEQVNDFMEYKSRNLSIGVNESINKKPVSAKYAFVKYLAPVFGIVLLFLVIYEPLIINSSDDDNSLQQNKLSYLLDTENPEELVMTIADDSPYSGYDFISDFDDSGIVIDEVYDEMVISDFFDDIDDQIDELYTIDLDDNDLYTIIDNLENDDFQQFLEELKNAKIIS